MSRQSKTSAGLPSTEPEFFIDRCLGVRTAAALAEAQHTSDPDWIGFGVGRGWALLTQDQRIRYHEEELALYKVYADRIAKIWP